MSPMNAEMMHTVRSGFMVIGAAMNTASGIIPSRDGARDIMMKRFFVSGWYETAYAASLRRHNPIHTVAPFG